MTAMPASAATKSIHPVLDPIVAAGLIDEAGARRALHNANAAGISPIAALNQLALADDGRVVAALALRFQLPVAIAADIPGEAIDLVGVSAAFLRRHNVLPLGWREEKLRVGVIDPERSDGLAALSFAAGYAAEPILMAASEQARAFDVLYGAGVEVAEARDFGMSVWVDDATRLRDVSDAGPAVRIVEAILDQAIEQGASDIHVEPMPDKLRIRFRIDGALQTVREEPAHLSGSIAARIKILADMDVADRRSLQDGRTSVAAKGRPVDVRVSTAPSVHGEAIAMRLLRRTADLLDLKTLGFSEEMLAIFERILGLRRGLFLITGPTGSGKTTTLYAMIERLRLSALKILSVEDPVEYFFPDITQVQVNEDAGITFPNALRAFLRQDPDVILVGEIRDAETARIATQAALTGHLVLATLHTNDAQGAVTRLADMGVDRFLVAATLAGVVSQRLVRRLCPNCRNTRVATEAERAMLSRSGPPPRSLNAVAEAKGCPACKQSGVSGRLAAAEGFLVDAPQREAILSPSQRDLAHVLGEPFTTLTDAAISLAIAGEISPAEAEAVRRS